MSTRNGSSQADPGQLAEAIAAVVLAHPAVVDLDGGPFGAVASHLPGRRVVGVRVGEHSDPVEVSLIARLGSPLPQLATELRRVISTVTGTRPIDVIINDVVVNDVITDDPPPDSLDQHGRCTR